MPGRWPGRTGHHASRDTLPYPAAVPHTGRPARVVLADGRTVLSQHRRRSPGRRRAARRSGFLLPVTATAIALIMGVTVAGYLMVRTDQGQVAGAAFAAAALPGSRAMAVLEQQREQMIVMDTATHTMHVVGAPKLASRASATTGSTTGSTTATTGGGEAALLPRQGRRRIRARLSPSPTT